MRLIRYGLPGAERPGMLDAQGILRDLSMLLPDIGPAQLAPRTLAALAAIDATRLPAVQEPVRLACPVAGVGKIVCVGLNYRDHALEAGLQPPGICDLAWVRRCLRSAVERGDDESLARVTWPLAAADVLCLARLDPRSGWYKQAVHARVKRVLAGRGKGATDSAGG